MEISTPGATAALPIARRLADFAGSFRLDMVPETVRDRARHSILDGVGVGLAASRADFARRSAEALASISGGGVVPVIGMGLRLPMRDAAFLNGILVHGLDYDDTHLLSAVHPTASLLPTLFAVGYDRGSSGAEMLSAYIVGLEAIARIGGVGGIELREAGFHPTSAIGIFGCVLAAGRLLGLSIEQLAMAQGIALSMSSGTTGSPADGASNKRLHPGWAAQAAITAAALARAGIAGPDRPYEGVRGLFRSLEAGPETTGRRLTEQTDSLGRIWESERIAIKPIPACHLTHACSDAGVALRKAHDFDIADIRRVIALVPAGIVQAVCEPLDLKRRPRTSYAAQFSIPYVVATSLVRRRFSLAELEPDVLADPEILALAARVEYAVDAATTYPVHRTGEVIVELRDGRVVRHREAINRGAPDRPLALADIRAKFVENATPHLSPPRIEQVAEAILTIDGAANGRAVVDIVCGP